MVYHWVLVCTITATLLVGGEALASTRTFPDPVPDPVPPIYQKLKNPHRTTYLVTEGRSTATIITSASGEYDALATEIQNAIAQITGVKVPIVTDQAAAAAVPITQNLIVLGNRSTNHTVEELYNRYYCLLDLKYPGPGGHALHSLHNPFGNGYNVLLCGGSDLVGVAGATRALIGKLQEAGGKAGSLSVGWLLEVQLSRSYDPSSDPAQMKIWDGSREYGDRGYFGWNRISKHMAMYYMTGRGQHAREALRLAFPDAKAKAELDEDGEMIENKDDPLAGPYHYGAHLMILFWDLIEESPVFTDAERLKITNAFARQLKHFTNEWCSSYSLTQPANWQDVGDRHSAWSTVSLYTLGRYFQKDYPNPVWDQCVRAAHLFFEPLRQSRLIGGMGGELDWQCTMVSVFLVYIALSGERDLFTHGPMQAILRGQEALYTGASPDWPLDAFPPAQLNLLAHLSGDGRWLTYRDRCGVDTDVFRLGQSFWPDARLQPTQPVGLVGKWTVSQMSEAVRASRNTGFGAAESMHYASYRSTPDATGDFVLVHGCYDDARNPYHSAAILECRLGGRTVLRGDRNQVLTRVDGMVEPQMSLDTALRRADVFGDTAVLTAETPQAGYSSWRRTWVQRTGRYALAVDELIFHSESDRVTVETLWEPGGEWRADRNALVIPPTEQDARTFEILPSDRVRPSGAGDQARARRRAGPMTLEWTGSAKQGATRTFFSLLAATEGGEALACVRVADQAAALALPQPALTVAGSHDLAQAELALLAQDHVFGLALVRAGHEGVLLRATHPIDLAWDFTTGRLVMTATAPVTLVLATEASSRVTLDGQPLPGGSQNGTQLSLSLPSGRHEFVGVKPPAEVVDGLIQQLKVLLEQGRASQRAQAQEAAPTWPSAPALATAFSAEVGGNVVDLGVGGSAAQPFLYAAADHAVHVLGASGEKLGVRNTDGAVRVVTWWPEAKLLLAGCEDEKVIAFDNAGNRKWVFTSEMDPEVYRAAKQYWFKSAHGHEGIHGLHTGVFLDGKSQAFVGSASTLEILDDQGHLVKRRAVFWGPGHKLQLMDAPDGSTNLLIAREPTGIEHLGIVNNRSFEVSYGFGDVPPGYTRLPNWTQITRDHIIYDDLVGDGHKVVVSELNGAWNRVVIWDVTGKPLWAADFGPGVEIPFRNIRDLDIGDINGDGHKEILVATSSGFVVALDHQCRRLWAVRLPQAPTVLKVSQPRGAAQAWIFVGCEDGSVLVLDGQGQPVRLGQVMGKPTGIAELAHTAEPIVVVATDEGQVKGFYVGVHP